MEGKPEYETRVLPYDVEAVVWSTARARARCMVRAGVCLLSKRWGTPSGEEVAWVLGYGWLIMATSYGPTRLGLSLQPVRDDEDVVEATTLVMTRSEDPPSRP